MWVDLSDVPMWLGYKDAAQAFGVSENTLHIWAYRGDIKRYRRGKTVMLNREEIARRAERMRTIMTLPEVPDE